MIRDPHIANPKLLASDLAVPQGAVEQLQEADGEYYNTEVAGGEDYCIIQWLALDNEGTPDEQGDMYNITTAINCVKEAYVDSIIPVPRLGTFTLHNAEASKRQKTQFKLSAKNRDKIIPLSGRVE